MKNPVLKIKHKVGRPLANVTGPNILNTPKGVAHCNADDCEPIQFLF